MFSVNPRSTRWVFTVNNYSEEEFNIIDQWLTSGVAKYAIVGKEKAPTTGTAHLQGYMHCEKKQYRRTMATAIKKRDGTCIVTPDYRESIQAINEEIEREKNETNVKKNEKY